MKDDNPYQPPAVERSQTLANTSGRQSIFGIGGAIVLICLGVHAFGFARWFLFFDATIYFDDLIAVLLVLSTVIGMACSVFAIRRGGLANRIVGVLAMLWFGYYVLLAIAES